jgi:hypothetical protein
MECATGIKLPAELAANFDEEHVYTEGLTRARRLMMAGRSVAYRAQSSPSARCGRSIDTQRPPGSLAERPVR